MEEKEKIKKICLKNETRYFLQYRKVGEGFGDQKNLVGIAIYEVDDFISKDKLAVSRFIELEFDPNGDEKAFWVCDDNSLNTNEFDSEFGDRIYEIDKRLFDKISTGIINIQKKYLNYVNNNVNFITLTVKCEFLEDYIKYFLEEEN